MGIECRSAIRQRGDREESDVPDVVPDHARREYRVLLWCARGAVGGVLGLATLNWLGWATGEAGFTRIFASWPYMPPWSALIHAVLAVAILAQLGRPGPALVWTGRGLAAVGGFFAAVFLAEYAVGGSFGLDRVFFSDGVTAAGATWPGRPSVWTALSAMLLAIAVFLTRFDRRRAGVVWQVCVAGAVVLPTVTASTYLFEAILLMDPTRSAGQAVGSVVSLLLSAAAVLAARPDRDPLAWLLARPDRWTLIRLIAILAGFPIMVGLSRLVFIEAGLRGDALWVLAIMVGSVLIGVCVFFVSQREQRLLIEKEALSKARAEAEARYRLVLEAAPDALIIVGADGRITMANAQADELFGYRRQKLVGSSVEDLLPERFRGKHIRHRGDFFAHPTVRPMGVGLDLWGLRRDGTEFPVAIRLSPLHTGGKLRVLAAIRDITESREHERQLRRQHEELVEAHQQLERYARFDPLTGLVNRAEALARLENALTGSRSPGTDFGVLFCDVDRFKTINDTYGHAVGDTVLRTVAERICQCVRHGDTVGRTGGDEMLVLLPGLHNLEEAARIAEKIRARAAEPIYHDGRAFDVSLSIGATLAIPGESVVDTTARADSAMYEAKRRGGDSTSCL